LHFARTLDTYSCVANWSFDMPSGLLWLTPRVENTQNLIIYPRFVGDIRTFSDKGIDTPYRFTKHFHASPIRFAVNPSHKTRMLGQRRRDIFACDRVFVFLCNLFNSKEKLLLYYPSKEFDSKRPKGSIESNYPTIPFVCKLSQSYSNSNFLHKPLLAGALSFILLQKE